MDYDILFTGFVCWYGLYLAWLAVTAIVEGKLTLCNVLNAIFVGPFAWCLVFGAVIGVVLLIKVIVPLLIALMIFGWCVEQAKKKLPVVDTSKFCLIIWRKK